MLFSTWLGNVDVFLRPRHRNTPITTSNAIPSGTPIPTPTFSTSLVPFDDTVLVLAAMVEIVELVMEVVAGEGDAELVTEDKVDELVNELVVELFVELVVVIELPIVVKIEMVPSREKVPFPV
ncbi:hypothetical protein EYB26_000504 [Talaromyces marneffei]|nr:uncharacterized protein EYB26_000504 [Talaromyces marneffei]QGA12859.1 hypothetical protein EYB26_000504 [Talaromyces marneffei]